MDRGVLYVGTAPTYLKQAVTSAESLKNHNNINVAIITSSRLEEEARNNSHFDSVIAVDNASLYDDVRDKVKNLKRSPFDRTLYLDGDTYVIDNIQPVFDLLSRVDIAAAHAPIRRVVTLNDVPEAFPELNTGVLLYNNNREIGEFFEKWQANLQNQIDSGRPSETVTMSGNTALEEIPFGRKHGQPPFRETLYHSDLQFAVLPTEYNYRGSVWAYDDVKIIHMGHGEIGSYMRKNINDRSGGRTYVSNTSTLYFQNGSKLRVQPIYKQVIKRIYYTNIVQKFLSDSLIDQYLKRLYRVMEQLL